MRSPSSGLNCNSEVHMYVYRNEGYSVNEMLKKTPERVNSRDGDGKTPLIVAASFNRYDIIDVLLASSLCDVNARDCDGTTALHEAADRGFTEVVKQIVDSGKCDVNITNIRGETALMKAAVYDYIDIVRILLKAGSINPDVTDILGQTALLVALREGSHMTIDALIQARCDVNLMNRMGETPLYMAIHSPLVKCLEPAKRLVETGYDLSVDKLWLLNEEKHNLFYQDDDFYASLRRKLRRYNSRDSVFVPESSDNKTDQHGVECSLIERRLQRTTSSSPFSMSPMVKQKIISTESFSNGLAMDWSTPPGSPLNSRRTSYRSSSSSSRPSLKSKSSFESDTTESPCSSPCITTYPAAHINFHMLTRQMSESCSEKTGVTSSSSVNSSVKLSDSVNDRQTPIRNISDISVNNYRRQQSEKLQRKTQTESRKLSLPSKPSVHFSSKVQIIDLSKRH